jgi:hypothetical protein
MGGLTMYTVLFILAIIIIFNVWKVFNADNTRQSLLAQYKLDEMYISLEDSSLFGIKFDEEKIILGAVGREKIYSFAQIAAVEVVENGVTLNKTNRGSQLLGTVVGGLILGPLGAVIGGLSASSRSLGRIQQLALKIFVDDRQIPVFTILFFQSSNRKGENPGADRVSRAREQLDRIHAQIVNAMRQVQQRPVLNSHGSGASDLKMLWEMKQAGALTEEEFAVQKSRLLGQGVQT